MFTDEENRPFFEPSDIDNDVSAKKTIDKEPSNKPHINKLPFIYFITAAVLTVFISLLSALEPTKLNTIPYFVSGIIGISICLFAVKHFRTFIHLMAEIDDLYELNRKMKRERNATKKEVNKVSSANEELEDTRKRLVFYNKNTQENLKRFRQCQVNMDEHNVKCVGQLQNTIKKAEIIEHRWYNELYQHQRDLLHHAFDRFCSNQTHIGMTKSEFDVFCSEIPPEFQVIFGKMGTFEILSDGKEYILLEDFAKTLDIFTEMQVNDCEIEFHLESVEEKPRTLNPMEALRTHKKNVKHHKKRSVGALSALPLPSILAPLSSLSEGKTIDSDSSDEEVDDRKYDDNLIKYQRKVVITKRTFSIHSLGSPTSPVVKKRLYSTRFDAEFVDDLTCMLSEQHLYEMPDINYQKTDEIERTNFTDEQMNTYMERLKQ